MAISRQNVEPETVRRLSRTLQEAKALVSLVAVVVVSSSLNACPMCESGGPADFGRYDRFEKDSADYESAEPVLVRKLKPWSFGVDARTVGSTEGPNEQDKHRQSQIGLTAAYRATPQFAIIARVPYARTSHSESDGHEAVNSGLGDAEILASFDFKSNTALRPGITLGLKAPSGENDLKTDDSDAEVNRLEEHGQIGTGAWDGMFMAHLRKSGDVYFSSTIGYRFNGENDFGYRYGSIVWIDLGFSRAVSRRLSLGIGSRLRHADWNSDSGAREADSGGTMFLVMPEASFSFGGGASAALRCTLPVINSLNGSQSETPGLVVALTQSI